MASVIIKPKTHFYACLNLSQPIFPVTAPVMAKTEMPRKISSEAFIVIPLGFEPRTLTLKV